MATLAPGSRLRGRTVELRTLADALGRAAGGRPAIVVVEGEAGIGKSRLLAEALEDARSQGLEVVAGRGQDLERNRPFGLPADGFGCTRSSPDPRRAAIAALLATHDGDRGVTTVSSDPGLQFQAVDAFVELVEALALRGPLVVGLDDLQWADPSSLLTLGALARRLTGSPVALRSACVPSPQRRAGADAGRPRRRRGPAPLPRPARPGGRDRAGGRGRGRRARPQAHGRGGRARGQPAVRHRAGGRAPVRRGHPDGRRAGRGGRDDPAPEPPPDHPAPAQLPARRHPGGVAAGLDPGVELLAHRAVGDHRPVGAGAVVGAGRGDPGPRPGGRRRPAAVPSRPHPRGHLRGPPGQRAPGPAPRGRPAAGRGGRRGPPGGRAPGPRGDPGRRRGHRLADPGGRRCRPAVARGRRRAAGAGHRPGRAGRPRTGPAAGRPGRRPDVVGAPGRGRDGLPLAARPRPRPAVDAQARILLSRTLVTQGRIRDALQELECVQQSPVLDDKPRAAAWAAESLARMELGDLAGAVAVAERVRTADGVPGDHPAITLALAALAIVEELRANLGRGLEIIDRAVRLADQSPQRWGHRNPLHLARGSILMGLDRLQDARSTLQTGRRISEELGVRWRLPFYQAVLGMERFLAGEWDDALAEFEEALELAAETGERYSLVLTHTLKALIALRRGELRQAEE